MLDKEDFIVLQHYLKEGLPKTTIAKKLGVSRMTVYRLAKGGKSTTGYGPRARKPSTLDPFKEYIRGRLAIYPELTAVRLLAEIVENGYSGKYTLVKDYTRLVRPAAPPEIEQRFEVSPGQQAQVDFATFKTSFGKVYALLVVLGWSRYLWVRFYFHQDQLTVLGGMHHAFLEFGGVPKTALFDRMKTAVARSDEKGEAIFNDEMLRFAIHCGFRPVACRPYRAKTKGKVERAVSYLRHSFFYGRQFRDLDDLNQQLEKWLKETANARIHGTTGEVPAVRLEMERSNLLPLPDQMYVPMVTLGRRVSRDGYVSYNGNDYSIPETTPVPEVTVAASLDQVRFYHGAELLACHPLMEGKGQRRLDPTHRGSQRKISEKRLNTFDYSELIEVQQRSLDVYEEVLR